MHLHNDDHVDVPKVLSQTKGINVNAANEDGYTPLHLAALSGYTDTVKALLQTKGIDANQQIKVDGPLYLCD